MTDVILNTVTSWETKALCPGDKIDIPDKIAQRWINNGIAHYLGSNKSEIKIIRFVRNKKKHVHIRDVRDNWIMQRFGDELARLTDKDILFTTGIKPDSKADINYYVNWTNEKPSLFDLPKTKLDIILFTHFEQRKLNYGKESKVLKWADKFTCMSKHGKTELLKRGIPKTKIDVSEGIGVSIDYRKKIKIGWAGKPNFQTGRKGNGEFKQLTRELDSDIFKFILYGDSSYIHSLGKQFIDGGADVEIINDYNYFLNTIDYYLSPSTIEGGPMDMLNAYYAGIPIVSMDIGFFHTIKTKDDYCFKDYDDLLSFFMKKQNTRKQKMKIIAPYNWDNYRKWHIRYFKKVLGI